ncbi:MAG: helicase-exonuclease AddAB subunit AddA [Bacillota bacterium]|nr:helicase-exonuclease AddAB subunit AddA [Bacillota bacterium]
MKQWTPEQLDAITCRDHNVLVAAAAGSGKTAVLVERIKRIVVEDGIDLDRLLIVTFTNAAAGEMRQRIAAAIVDELGRGLGNEEALRKQLNLLNRASISTLHAFCIEVVRRYFYLINVDPRCKVADTVESELLKKEALEETFEFFYEQGDDLFLELVEMFGDSKDDQSFQEMILRLYSFMQSQPSPWDWLQESIDTFAARSEEEFAGCAWVRSVEDQIRLQLNGARDLFQLAMDLSLLDGGPLDYEPALQNDLQIVDDLLHALNQGLTMMLPAIASVKHSNLKRIKSEEVQEELKNECRALRDEGKKTITEVKQFFGTKTLLEYQQDMQSLHPYMEYLYQVVERFSLRYQEKKNQKGIVDFNDMEHYVLTILSYPEAAQEYRQKFAYIFVDEYQDSNGVQEAIINLIKREHNLFLVGDVKQSIYRFRQADPSLFIDKYYRYGKQATHEGYRIDLNQNFRSRKEILAGVNHLFRNMMSVELGELAYNDDVALNPGIKEGPDGNPEIGLYLLENRKTEEISEELEDMGNTEMEASLCADIIKDLVGQEIYDADIKANRKIEYRDIVLLMRATRSAAPVFVDQFTEEGIPVYADVDSGFFDALEVQVFMNLLQVIDNRQQDIPLLSVMRSPLFNFSIEALMEIRINQTQGGLFGAIEAYRKQKDDDLAVQLTAFADTLSQWKEDATHLSVEELIQRIFEETGYYYYVGAMPGGEQRQANLRLFLERARQFQSTSLKGLFNFIKFIDNIQKSSSDMGMAKVLGENDNVVRIMSIHKSKGLEFPVVMLGGMGKKFNLRDAGGSLLIHKDLGLGPRYINPSLRKTNETLPRFAMKHKIRMESLSEEMRILYVAATRAEQRLIMIGSVRDLSASVRKWSRPLSPFALSKGQSYLDWIGPVIMRHPDGTSIRNLAETTIEETIFNVDQSRWKVQIFQRADIATHRQKTIQNREEYEKFLNDFTNPGFSPERENLFEKLNWEYPYKGADYIPSKVSVTELKKLKSKQMDVMQYSLPELKKTPKFMKTTEGFSPAEVGTLTHLVMQHLDFTRISEPLIHKQLEEMVENEILTPLEFEAINVQQITQFFGTSLGQRALKADEIYREVPFNLLMSAAEVFAHEVVSEEQLLIQGVIDLYFQEDQGLILVDYKTDAYWQGGIETIKNRYDVQLATYKKALETIVGIPVHESYLYLFRTGEVLKM